MVVDEGRDNVGRVTERSPTSGSRKRPPRRRLTHAEAKALVEALRRGGLNRIEDVEFPADLSADIPRLHDVEFVNVKLWLTLDGGWFGRAAMSRCRFVDCQLDALRVRKADIDATSFERVVFGGRSFGGFHAARVEGVTLIDCRVRDHPISESSLIGLTVTGGSMTNMNVTDCELRSVRIAANLDLMNLAGCRFENTNMSDSSVGEVSIFAWRDADLRLPKSRSGFLIVPVTALDALEPVLPQLSIGLRKRLVDDWLTADPPPTLVSERFLQREFQATAVETEVIVIALLAVAVSSLQDVTSLMGPRTAT